MEAPPRPLGELVPQAQVIAQRLRQAAAHPPQVALGPRAQSILERLRQRVQEDVPQPDAAAGPADAGRS